MALYKPTAEELKEVLELHAKWARGEDGGKRANMSNWDLSFANLYSANLCSADLRSAKNLSLPIACPDTGAFTAWKKCKLPNGSDCIVELLIPADAKRSSATTRKCRCDKAEVVSITGMRGVSYKKAHSARTICFVYEVGKTVSVPDFDEDRWNECSTGIHFFITRQEAVDWQ